MQALIDFSGTLRSEFPRSEGSLRPEYRYEVMIETSTGARRRLGHRCLRGTERDM